MPRICLVWLLGGAMSLLDGHWLSEQEDAVPKHWAKKIPSKEIDGLHQVTPQLYRGPQPTAQGMQELAALGIRTVINLRTDEDVDERRAKDTKLRCIWLPVSWNPLRPPDDADVVRFLRLVTDPKQQPVYVHCRQGVDRTGLMIAAYRLVIRDWERDDALREMRHFGFHSRYAVFERYLRNLDVAKMKEALAEK